MKSIQTAHIISHTHWDREWYLNSKFTNEWLVPFFDALFAMLAKEPRYRFVLDGQTSMIEDCCEQLERLGRDPVAFKLKLRQYVTERRLLVGPYYLQPDWQLVSDEALVRNLLIGHATALELGPVMRVGWLLDNFGQISQAPQIHREFGLEGVYLWRGVEMDPARIESEFLWQGPDGSTLTAVYLVGSYRNGMRLASYAESMRERLQVEVEKLGPFATSPNVLVMNGYDQEMAPDDVMPWIAQGGMDWDSVHVVQSTPDEYVAVITQQHGDLQQLKGALYSGRYISVFPGILSGRMYLKTTNDACQRLLEKHVEPLATVAWALGAAYPSEGLLRCWKLLLKSQPHDSICGVSIDDVHRDMEVRYDSVRALARELAGSALATWVDQIDTTHHESARARWVVINTSARPRTVVVTFDRDVPADRVLRTAEEGVLASQAIGQGRTVVAIPEIPALGYITVYEIPREDNTTAQPRAAVTCNVAQGTLENELVHIKIEGDGTLTLTDKLNHATFTCLAEFEDGSDAGDTYNYSPALHDHVVSSRGCPAQVEFLETGPLRARVRIAQVLPVPEGLAPDRKSRAVQTRDLPLVTWVTLEAHSPVLAFHTRVKNTVKDHRLRVLFTTGLDTTVSHAETQFDVVEHPIHPLRYDDSSLPADVKEILLGAREPEPTHIFPQRAFVDLSDATHGLAILNRGLAEYQVLTAGNTVALTLFRSVGWIARSDLTTRIGDAGPLIAVPDAQCLRTMDFHFAVVPHAGDWRSGQVSHYAEQFNTDLLLVNAERHAAALADCGSFLAVKDSGHLLRVTAIKRSEDATGIVVRLHNPTGTPIEGRLWTCFEIVRAAYAGLDEREQAEIDTYDRHSIPIVVPAKKIVTIRLQVARRSLLDAPRLSNIRVRTEGVDESSADLEEHESVVSIDAADIRAEEERAAELERVLAAAEDSLRIQGAGAAPPGDLTGKLHLASLQLDVETARRAYWEARLSATLLRKSYLEAQTSGTAESDGVSIRSSLEASLREIGLVLNQTRVSKRAYEYIVDCYRRLARRETS